MFRIRQVQSGLLALVAFGAIAAKPVPARRVSSGCGPNSPHAIAFVGAANSTFTHLDGPKLAKLGWRTAPTSVTLETHAATCDAVVAAHNAFAGSTDPDYRVTTPVIARADHSYLLEVPPTAKRVETIIFVYDSTLKFKTIY